MRRIFFKFRKEIVGKIKRRLYYKRKCKKEQQLQQTEDTYTIFLKSVVWWSSPLIGRRN